MKKIIKSKKANSKKMLLYAGLLVGALALTEPTIVYAEEGEVLYEEQDDNYETEPIEETDIVRDNTVVNQDEEQNQEQNQEEKQEEKEENNQSENDKEGSTVLPGDQQGNEGQYWDPNIKTEEEKKHINEEHHEEEHHEEEHHEEEHHEEEHHEETTTVTTTTTTSTVSQTPVAEKTSPAPKTGMGDVDWTKLFAIVGFGGLGSLGLASLVTSKKIDDVEKKYSRKR